MRILVLGAAGFIGTRLVNALSQTWPEADIIASDLRLRPGTPSPTPSRRIRFVEGNMLDPQCMAHLFEHPVDAVFHLAASLTIEAETTFERGMEVNVQGLIKLLEACRLQGNAPKFLFASSISTFGGELPETVDDYVRQTPQTSYGTQKVIAEQLINDYSRRGFLDGRALRLPIVLTHPGPPTSSVSDRIASLVREGMAGAPVRCGLHPDTPMAVTSVDTVVAAMLTLMQVSAETLTDTRAMNLPALTVTPRELLAAVARKRPDGQTVNVEWVDDPVMQSVVESWPKRFVSARASQLGLRPDASADAIVEAYLRG